MTHRRFLSWTHFSWPILLLALIFLFSGITKLDQSELLFAGVMQYQIVDANDAFFIADWLPWIEIALGVALMISLHLSSWARPFLGVAALLQIVFLAALVSAAWRGLEVVCVCFGSRGVGTAGLFLQELLLLLLTGIAFFWPSLSHLPSAQKSSIHTNR